MYDPSTFPLVQDKVLLDQLKEHGAEHFLDQDSSASIWEKMTRHCGICNQWCSSTRAVAFHLQSKHGRLYSQSRDWASRRIKARALEVINPCKWCKASFSETRCVRGYATLDGRQQQATTRRRPAGRGSIFLKATNSEEAAQQQPQARASQLFKQHGSLEQQHESSSSSSRRCSEQTSSRCGLQSAPSNYRSYSSGAAKSVAEMERRQGVRNAKYRSTFENFVGGLLLPRAT